jgi:signal transduction histidine kinase/CheY-like chemotaxis protein
LPDNRADAFARLFEAVHEGVYIGLLGPRDTKTLAANPHLKLIFGYAEDTSDAEIRPFEPSRFVDPQARGAFIARLAADGAVTDYLLRLRRLDNSAVWVEVTAHAEPPAADGSVRIDALMRNVSERKKVEDETRDLYGQLLQAEKLAALGQTISGVAHELNNPLATILTWAERLSQGAVDEKTKRGLDTILSESERAAKIVRNLLTFARKRQSTRTMVDLNTVVRETLALRSYEQRITNISVVDGLTPALPKVFADAHQIQQVLLNLIINAEQAMLGAHGRGTLLVRSSYDVERESIVLEISDDGPGIAVELQPKIFDPFFTTKEVGKGTGLGLTVAYAIVQEHGGRIRLASQTGYGASFHVELPVSGTPRRPVAQTPAPPDYESLIGSTVLIVEDEPALAAAVSEALTDAGFIVDRAGDGQEAMRRVNTTFYDLIVCDLKMPKVDGMRFYETLAASHPQVAQRVLFVTGDVAGTEAEKFLQESGCKWLAKPFRLGDLLKTAREILA